MSLYDASVVLNLHKEGELLHKTLISLNNAARIAVSKGYKLELVAVLDCADVVTSDIIRTFTEHSFQKVSITSVKNGSLGLSRNDGVAMSQGEYIFMADGDDLVSENFIYNSLEYSKRFNENTVFFPEAILGFGDSYYVSMYQRLGEVSPLVFIETHPYISRVFGHRNIFERHPYSDVRLSTGYAFEDWHFNCNIVASGVSIEVVPDTILFYRQRKGSLLKEANSLSSKTIPPSALFIPETFMDVINGYNTVPSKTLKKKELVNKYSTIDSNVVGEEIRKANSIEPLIRLNKYKGVSVFSNVSLPSYLGKVYYKISPVLGKVNYDDIFILPFISNGGAEKYINEVMWSLYRQRPEANVLVILCEGETLASDRGALPPNVTCLDFYSFSSNLSVDQRCILIVKILQSLTANCRVHIRQSVIGMEFLERFSKLFDHLTLIFYRFTDVQFVDKGAVVTGYSPLPILKENIEHISLIICDNEAIIQKDALIVGNVSKWHFLPAPIEIKAYKRIEPEMALRKKVLWASRLDHQKRVQLLPGISNGLAQYGFELDVYGETVLGGADIKQLIANGIHYKGKFKGLSSVSLENYTFFLYTSYYDGLPNVLLEALAAGMIIVAPNVGGISEVVKHLETGYLIENNADDDLLIRDYVNAIKYLDETPSLLKKIRINAFNLLKKVHSYENYDQCVSTIFLKSAENISSTSLSDDLLLSYYEKQLRYMKYEIKCLQQKEITEGHVNVRWHADSKAHKLAALYVETAQGPNMLVKIWRFGKSLSNIAIHKIKKRYFN